MRCAATPTSSRHTCNRSGVVRGDRVLLMLGNVPALWELTLACMKLGCPLIPTTTHCSCRPRLADRVPTRRSPRGRYGCGVSRPLRCRGARVLRVLVQGSQPGWHTLPDAGQGLDEFVPGSPTMADHPLFLYFTSGTTAKPKLVVHTHASYPIGHLSTMYWLGLQPGDRHLNLSCPGGRSTRGARSLRRGMPKPLL